MTARRGYDRPYVAPFNPGITQKIKTALYESGHEDLVSGLLDSGLKEIEALVEEQRKKIQLLEEAERQRLTETGVNKLIEAKLNADTSERATWFWRSAVGAILIALGALAGHYLGKP